MEGDEDKIKLQCCGFANIKGQQGGGVKAGHFKSFFNVATKKKKPLCVTPLMNWVMEGCRMMPLVNFEANTMPFHSEVHSLFHSEVHSLFLLIFNKQNIL